MFLIIALILLLLWLGGVVFFATIGGLIHILLVLAIISLVWHFFFGRSRSSI